MVFDLKIEKNWLQENIEKFMVLVPIITCEITFSQLVSELVLGVHVFDLDVGVQIDSVKQPIQRNSVGSGHVSHRRTSTLYDPFDHSFIVFKVVQLSFELRRNCVCDNVIHIGQFLNVSVTASFRFDVGIGALDFTACSTSRNLIIDLIFSTVISHCLMGVSLKNLIVRSPHPTDREQGFHTSANQHPKK